MSNVPERIWLQWHGDGDPDDPGEVCVDEVTWEQERIFDGDIEYVRRDKADALADALEMITTFDPSDGQCDNGYPPQDEARMALDAYRDADTSL